MNEPLLQKIKILFAYAVNHGSLIFFNDKKTPRLLWTGLRTASGQLAVKFCT